MRRTLRTRSQFQRLYTQGKKAVGHYLVAFADEPTENEAPSTVAFVASRKVGGAVQRNRAKRLLREAYARVAPDLRPHTMVFVARRSAADPSTRMGEVEVELRALLTRLGYLSPSQSPNGGSAP